MAAFAVGSHYDYHTQAYSWETLLRLASFDPRLNFLILPTVGPDFFQQYSWTMDWAEGQARYRASTCAIFCFRRIDFIEPALDYLELRGVL